MSQNTRPPTTPSPESERSDSPRPLYFLVRNDGTLTPLVAVDELDSSLHILGAPAVLSYANTKGMISLGVAARSERQYIVETSTQSFPNGVENPLFGQSAVNGSPKTPEKRLQATNGGTGEDGISHIEGGNGVQESPPKAAVPLTGQSEQKVEHWRQGVSNGVEDIQVMAPTPILRVTQLNLSQATVDAIVNAASHTGLASHKGGATANGPATSNRATTSSNIPTPTTASILPNAASSTTTNAPTAVIKKKEKVYCSFWIRRGECDYTQQGCLYKHEMPTDRDTLKELGISQIPRWWREANAVKVGESGWSERAGMWRAAAGSGTGLLQARQGTNTQTSTTLQPTASMGMDGTRMMAPTLGVGLRHPVAVRAALGSPTPATSPVGLAFARPMVGSRHSPPSAAPPPTASSPSHASAPAFSQRYTPTTLGGHVSPTPAPSPVSFTHAWPLGRSRLSPPSAAPLSSSHQSAIDIASTAVSGTAATAASGSTPTTQSIPIPGNLAVLEQQPKQATPPSTSPPHQMLFPTYQPLTPSSPGRHTSSPPSSTVPSPKPVNTFDFYNSIPTPPHVHRRLFVAPGESQYVESGAVKAEREGMAKDEAVRLWQQKEKRLGSGQKNGVLVEFGEG